MARLGLNGKGWQPVDPNTLQKALEAAHAYFDRHQLDFLKCFRAYDTQSDKALHSHWLNAQQAVNKALSPETNNLDVRLTIGSTAPIPELKEITRDSYKRWCEAMAREGYDFHPDDPLDELTDSMGLPFFTEEQISNIEEQMSRVWQVFGPTNEDFIYCAMLDATHSVAFNPSE